MLVRVTPIEASGLEDGAQRGRLNAVRAGKGDQVGLGGLLGVLLGALGRALDYLVVLLFLLVRGFEGAGVLEQLFPVDLLLILTIIPAAFLPKP